MGILSLANFLVIFFEEKSYFFENHVKFWDIINLVFIAIFLTEQILKICIMGKKFFK